MELEYIVIQAGGRGSRLETLTLNKPKCLVPVDNLPMIFHLFRKFPKSKFIVIGDYKSDVLNKYLSVFSEVEYKLIVTNEKGTCSGINEALEHIPASSPFMLLWCDLILANRISIPAKLDQNYVGVSGTFDCRWSYIDDQYVKTPSAENGVAGFFIFKNKSQLDGLSPSGEFVAWLSSKSLEFERFDLSGSREIGTVLSYYQSKINKPNCRPFNQVTFNEDFVEKIPLDEQGRKLAALEEQWYRKVTSLNYRKLPEIYSYSPLKMERINGKNIYEYNTLTYTQKKEITKKIILNLKELHSLEPETSAIYEDCYENYVLKTFERLEKVESLVPFAKQEYITINGKEYKNVFFIKDELINEVKKIFPSKFSLIHGDPTFSNTILHTDSIEPIFLDPRGYFGKTQYYGDVNYDWAKVYYSVVGNYDQFNLKKFSLEIEDTEVSLKILSSNWEDMENTFFEETGASKKDIKFLHAIIWLSLTTYAWEDYDSICGAFYNGLIHLDEAMKHE